MTCVGDIKAECNKYLARIRELESFLRTAKFAINLKDEDYDTYCFARYYLSPMTELKLLGNLKGVVDTTKIKFNFDGNTYTRVEFDKVIRSKKQELKEMHRLYSKYESLLNTELSNKAKNDIEELKSLRKTISDKTQELQNLKYRLHSLEKNL